MKGMMKTMLGAVIGSGLTMAAVFTMVDFNQTAVSSSDINPFVESGAQLTNYTNIASASAVDLTTAAESVVNSVVHVKVTQDGEEYIQVDPFKYFFYGQQGERKQMPDKHGSGSGVVISSDGYIVTNNHVIDRASEIQITTHNNETYTAEVIGTDPATDLALLKIQSDGLTPARIANSDEAKLGEWVLAVGNPFNLNSTVTAGIVSAKGRNINILPRDAGTNYSPVESFIQTDAAVNPGNSGGALVNAKGELIGINTAIKSPTGSYSGYAFAVPSNIAVKVVEDLIEFGTVQRGYIGVSIRTIDQNIIDEYELEVNEGVFIAGLLENGAADEAGIEEGDVILKVGDIAVDQVSELQEQISRFRPGDKVSVTLNRNGKVVSKQVVLRNRHGNTDIVEEEDNKLAVELGAEFQELSNEEMEALNIDNGVKITRMNGGKLRSSGIREGYIIQKIDSRKIESLEDLETALKGKKGGVLFEGLYPNGKQAYYGVGM